MGLKFEDVKEFIRQAAARCESLKKCGITDAYPPLPANCPVTDNICAVGLLQAQRGAATVNGVTAENENVITAFADIYTPVEKGGNYSTDCALELCAALKDFNKGSGFEAAAEGCSYISSCYAYKTRVTVKAVKNADFGSDIESLRCIAIDDYPYICRSASYELYPPEAIESYGEACPTGFSDKSERCTARIKRYIGDDGETLCDLKYPFTLDDLSNGGFYLTECALIKYEVGENMMETVTIQGRRAEYGEQ